MMVKVLNGTQACSVPLCGNHFSSLSRLYNCRVHFHCLNCSSYVDLRLRLEITCARNLSGWFGRRRKKGISQNVGDTNSCIKPTKVVGLGILSPCEEERTLVLDSIGDEYDYDGCFKNVLPPWGSLPDKDSETQSPLDDRVMISEKNTDTTADELYYLEEKNEETLSKRLLKLSRSNKVRSSLALYHSMNLSGLVPNPHACNSLLSCLLRNGRFDDALTIFESMKSREITTGHTYSLILKAVAAYQSCDAALAVFKEAEKEDKTKKHIDSIVYNTMIAIYGKEDNWVQAESLWRSMQVNGHRGTVVTYRLLICTFVRCGQNELAFDAYHEMVENGISSGNDAMEAIIGACTREGQWELSLQVVQSMLDDGFKPSLIACNALINSLAKASKVRLAFKIFDLMKSLGHEPDSYSWNALLVALNGANRPAEALRLFEKIRNDHSSLLNLHVYNTCLMSCQKLALWDRAVQILQEMEASGFSISVTSYNLVIGACEAARQPRIAWQVYQHMVELKHSPDVFTLLTLTRCCIWGSLWNEVEEILSSSPPDGSLYNTAIQGMCLRKKADLARKLYKKMREIGLKPDGKTRSLMLQNLPPK